MTSPSSRADAAQARSTDTIAAGTILAAALYWLWYSTTHELSQDESYYWQWSRHLAVGYYDNTPLMAFLINLMTHLFGNTQLGVRSGAVLCSSVCAWFLYKLGKTLFGERVGLIALGVTLCVPLIGTLAFIMTADPPQMAFWAMTAYVAWHAVQSQAGSGKSWSSWLLAGALAGLAAMSKLNGILILPSVALFLILEPSQRRWLAKPQPYLAALVTLAVFSPFIWWNHTHADAFWLHINHMSSRTDGSRFTLKYFGDFFAGQAILISPLLFLSYLWAMLKTPFNRFATPEMRYCWSLSALVFAETAAVSLKSRVEANWAVAAYVTGFILIAQMVSTAWERRSCRIWNTAALALAGTITVLTYISTFTVHALRIKPLDEHTDELYGWVQTAQRVEAERVAMGTNPFIFGVDYQMPSEMAFYLPDQPQTYSLVLKDRGNEYQFWENAQDLVGRDAILIDDASSPDDVANDLANAGAVFTRVQLQPALNLYRPGIAQPIRTIQIIRCYGFKGYRREQWQSSY